MSARSDMYNRIIAAMPEDEEVVAWCRKQLAGYSKSAEKTKQRTVIAEQALRTVVEGSEMPVTAKEIAIFINMNCGSEDDWNTRTASYYLRRLVAEGKAEEVADYENAGTTCKLYRPVA